MAFNLIEEIHKLRPQPVIEFVTVNSVSNGVSNVTSIRGFTYNVQGDAVGVGDSAWVKDGVIIGQAPSGMPTYNVVI